MSIRVADVRRAAWHYLSEDVASAANLSLLQLQSFVAGSFTPDEKQLHDLARRMGLRNESI
jgi:hypothetical protein